MLEESFDSCFCSAAICFSMEAIFDEFDEFDVLVEEEVPELAEVLDPTLTDVLMVIPFKRS